MIATLDQADRSRQRWLWLTIPLTILLVLAALAGVLVEDLYAQDAPLLAAQLIGTDVVSLLLIVPVLVVSGVLARRGAQWALLVWLGTLLYLVYTYLVFAFSVHFNALFPVYIALLGGSFYGLCFGLVAVCTGARANFAARGAARLFSATLLLVVVLFYAMNLGEIIPAVFSGETPQSVIDIGLPTYFVHVLDLALFMPAFGVAAVLLWQRKQTGFVMAGVALVMLVLMMAALLGMFAATAQRGLPVDPGDVIMIGVVGMVYLGLLIGYLRQLGGEVAT
ncbi:MAG: hypothetical protein JW910_08105 [Anaerolineae bacterium]|nr:hypothetical protein [Anaerolineae bacterium]